VVVVAIAVVIAATCVALGFWQLRRLHDRRVSNALIRSHRVGPVVEVRSASQRLAGLEYRPGEAAGRYDTAHEVLVFGRALNEEPGHLVVTPLVLDDGSAVLVIRGWVPFEMQTPPVEEATPPSGPVSVTGFLVPDDGDGRVVPEDGVIRTLDVRGIASTLPYRVAALPIELRSQNPPQPGGLPRPYPLPELSEGPHLSYAIQWFLFATIALIGGLVLYRRDRREERDERGSAGVERDPSDAAPRS
jgi:cytochrome oxidase assembly protein ShyY1